MSLVLNHLRKVTPAASLAAAASRTRAVAHPLRQLSTFSTLRSTVSTSWRPVLSAARSLLTAKPARRAFATDTAAAEPAAAAAQPAAAADATAAGEWEKKLAEKEKLIAEQKKKIEADAKTIKEGKDELLRAYAEMQNVRRIAKSDVAAANSFALQGIGKRLVDVLDNLQRATSSCANAGIVDAQGNATPLTDAAAADQLLRSLLEGVQLTEKVFLKALGDHGFKRFGAAELVGNKLDANTCNVLFSFEDPTKPAGTVAQVIKDGYTLNDRVLRAADVATVKPSKPAAAPAAPSA